MADTMDTVKNASVEGSRKKPIPPQFAKKGAPPDNGDAELQAEMKNRKMRGVYK